MVVRLALIGEDNETVPAHRAIPKALALASADENCPVEAVWVGTHTITHASEQLAGFHALWSVPASPYASMAGALDAIRFARESGRAFLGTCGGFQHAIIEYARNVLGIQDAGEPDTLPEAGTLVVTPLACPLVEEPSRCPRTPCPQRPGSRRSRCR